MFASLQARSCPKKILFLVLTLALAACDTQVQSLDGQDGAQIQPASTDSIELDVVAQKGPFLEGSTVTLYEINSAGAAVRSKDVSKQFGNLGRFRVNVPWSGPTLIEIKGPFYDEFQGTQSQEQSTLRSVIDVEKGGKGIGNINVLTDLFSARVLYHLQRGETFETAMSVARQELKDSFGLALGGGAMPSDLDLMNGDGSLAPDNANLLLFSGTVMATGSVSIVSNLASEFATSGALVCGLESLRPYAAGVSIDALAENLHQLDSNATPPDSADLAAANPLWLQAGSTACNGGSGTGGGTTDHQPMAQDDAASVNEDASFSADLRVNDSGLEDGGIVYLLSSAPAHGTAVVNSDGSYSYTPAPDFNGTDTFGYIVTDQDGDSASASVMMTVIPVDDVPVANDDAFSTMAGSSVDGDLSSNDTGFGDGGIVYSLNGAPANGSVSVNANGHFTYTPNSGFGGTDSFGYRVIDADGDQANATVDVMVSVVNTNATPVAVNDSFSVDEDSSVSGDLRANDSGLEDGGIVYSLGSTPAHGNAVVDASGGFQYVPTADFNGSDSFTYSVSDIDGESATATVSLDVNAVDDQPIAVADSATVDEDSQVSGDLRANDSGLVDGGIAYYLQSAASNGSAQVQSDGSYTYTPASDFNGSDSFSYSVSDADGDEATATVNVTVNPVNDVPVAVSDTAVTPQGEAVAITVLANDSGLGDGIATLSATQPGNGTVTVDTDNVVSYTPDASFFGSDSFSYTITDANGDLSVASVGVNVECSACGQAVLSWDPPTTNTDGSQITDLAAFNVYIGTAPGDRSNKVKIDDPAATTYTVDGLSAGWTYYFVVTAENAGGAESSPSNEVSKAIVAGAP